MIRTSNGTQSRSDHGRIDGRDRRALTETLLVQRDAEDLFRVYGESGDEYVVDAREPACTCPDFQYRSGRCKHIRRVELETGAFDVEALAAEVEDAIADVDDEIATLASKRAQLVRLQSALDRFRDAETG